MYKTSEWCGNCGTDNEFEFENVQELKPVQECKECQRQLVLCSECLQEGCRDCKNGCNFEQYID